MKIDGNLWYMVTGKAGYGKTVWIREHLYKIPANVLNIIDFNGNDYNMPEFKDANHITVKLADEIDDFLFDCYKRGKNVVVLGDCDSYIRKNEMSERRKMFINSARNRKVCCIFDTKRVMNIPPDVRSRINQSVIFHKTEGKDIQAHEEWCGEDKGFFDGLRELDVGEHVIYDHDKSLLTPVEAPVKMTARKVA